MRCPGIEPLCEDLMYRWVAGDVLASGNRFSTSHMPWSLSSRAPESSARRSSHQRCSGIGAPASPRSMLSWMLRSGLQARSTSIGQSMVAVRAVTAPTRCGNRRGAPSRSRSGDHAPRGGPLARRRRSRRSPYRHAPATLLPGSSGEGAAVGRVARSCKACHVRLPSSWRAARPPRQPSERAAHPAGAPCIEPGSDRCSGRPPHRSIPPAATVRPEARGPPAPAHGALPQRPARWATRSPPGPVARLGASLGKATGCPPASSEGQPERGVTGLRHPS